MCRTTKTKSTLKWEAFPNSQVPKEDLVQVEPKRRSRLRVTNKSLQIHKKLKLKKLLTSLIPTAPELSK